MGAYNTRNDWLPRIDWLTLSVDSNGSENSAKKIIREKKLRIKKPLQAGQGPAEEVVTVVTVPTSSSLTTAAKHTRIFFDIRTPKLCV